jgi:hypothetical protein
MDNEELDRSSDEVGFGRFLRGGTELGRENAKIRLPDRFGQADPRSR